MKSKIQIFTGSTLKIIGMLLMVVDHTAVQFRINVGDWYIPMRLLGRISFPIFAYLIVDGMIHTKNAIKYIGQMLILGVVISLCEFLFTRKYTGNVLTTLGFSALAIYFLRLPKWWKVLAILPFTLVFLADSSFGSFMPLRFQYSGFGASLILGFYGCYLLADRLAYLHYNDNNQYVEFLKTPNFTMLRNILSINFFIILNVGWYYVARKLNIENHTLSEFRICSLLAIIPIIMYNGKRGYNKPWFKWACYLFYPVQFVLIYVAYYLFK